MANKKRVMLVFGTRPEVIKLAPVHRLLCSKPEIFDVSVCVTGQHREMLDQGLLDFNIEPHSDLGVMQPNQTLTDISAKVMTGVAKEIDVFKPDILVVHGDTTTTMASALAGFYRRVRIAHVEAGMRTFDLRAPYPEELNRQVVSKLADWHFAPTAGCRENLLNEKVSEDRVFVTGNTVVDALNMSMATINTDHAVREKHTSILNHALNFDWLNSKYILVTGHRRENLGEGLLKISRAIAKLAKTYPSAHFVFPVHLNPNVRVPIRDVLGRIQNVHLVEPFAYKTFLLAIKNCSLVLTDSGGIQEEAPSFGKPVLVTRDKTERPEGLDSGIIKLVGTNETKIFNAVSELLENPQLLTSFSRMPNPYGDGNASKLIVSTLENDNEC